MTEPLLLCAVQIATHAPDRALTRASGFFFQRGERLYLVTSRHVLFDEPSGHYPNRISFDLHLDATNMVRATTISVLLYQAGQAQWRQGQDAAGEIDVAVLEIDRSALPAEAVYGAFTPAHLQQALHEVEVGSSVLIVGFPLGFQDTLHHLPVVRQAVIASAFGLRFQGQGYFLTDARTHRGTSGAPVVLRAAADEALPGGLPWKLLGVHAGRLDMLPRDTQQDENLGLNCTWYADILMTLTEPAVAPAAVLLEAAD
jgi:hypothetical protein